MTDYPEASYPILSRHRFRPSIRGSAVRDDVDGAPGVGGRPRTGRATRSIAARPTGATEASGRASGGLRAGRSAVRLDSTIGAYAQARRGRPKRKRRLTGIY